MKNQTLYEKATDPRLYDSKDLESWIQVEGKLDGQSRKNFFNVLKQNSQKWRGSKILDVGCGSGWLSNEIGRHAKEVTGIDPSCKNIEFAKKNFENIKFKQETLEEFKNEKFDLIIANMVFEHIKDLESAFDKISSMMNSNSEFHLVVGDYNYMKSDRKKYDLMIENIDDDSYVVETSRNEGLTKDVIRKVEVYLRYAIKANLELSNSSRIYNEDNKIIGHFLNFRKTEFELNKNVVACIGKSTIERGDPVYLEIKRIGSLLIDKGFGIIHGGYCGGAMEAVSKGAQDEINKLQRDSNLNIGVPLSIFDTMLERNDIGEFTSQQSSLSKRIRRIIDPSFAVLVLPSGGVGTVTELIYTFHLNQIYKMIGLESKPIILYGEKWQEVLNNMLQVLDLKNEGEEWIYNVNNLEELSDVLDIIKLD